MRNKKEFLKVNNKGASLVTVILTIAFVAILVSVVLMTSMVNYKMKRMNVYSKDTFYSAEQVLDEINIGLQRFISDSLSTAYTDIMKNYSDYSVEQKRTLLQTNFYENMWDKLEVATSGHTQYDTTILYDFLKPSTEWAPVGEDDGFGAVVRAVDSTGQLTTKGTMLTYDNGIVLKDLRVYYKDSRGVVSIIQTDVRLTYPDFDFAATTSLPNLSSYGIIADGGMEVLGTAGSELKIAGNVYADSLMSTGTAATTMEIEHTGENKFIVKHDMVLQDSAFVNEESGTIWADGIETIGGDLDLKGQAFIADDLNINGNESNIKLAGIYNGYGNSISDAEKSSAILVNGSNSVIDLANLSSITLAGHAYVGTKTPNLFDEQNQEAGVNPEGVVETQNDIYTGESIAVKSNQLMYLVPAECIGVKKETEAAIIGKNPMTADEYEDVQEFLTNYPNDYMEVSAIKPVSKLGGDSLAPYIQVVNGVAQAEKVFVTTNGSTLVYYYMKFINEDAANAYFSKYYNTNKEVYDRYTKSYIDLLTFPVENNVTTIRTAAHGLKGDDATEYELLENTIDGASAKLSDNQAQYQERFTALCTLLTDDFTKMTEAEFTGVNDDDQVVFDNLIDVDQLRNYIEEIEGLGSTSTVIDGTQGKVVLWADDVNTYNLTDANVHLVISTGNVNIQVADFKGTVISNGKVTVNGNTNIEVDEARVNALLRYYIASSGEMVANVLRDGKEYIFFLQDQDDEDKKVATMADLIVYENWKKE